MVYLSLQNAVNAYNEIQGKVKNRFWGLIAFTYSCDKIVESTVQYSVDLSKGANLLENIFRFNEVGKLANTSTWYFTLSNNWISKGFDLFFSEKVDIFDIIVWCYRKVKFEEELDCQSLLEKFVNDFHFPREAINEWFNINLNHKFIFELNCPSDTEILINLNIDNRDPFTLTTDKGKNQVVVANACDLSRAPFVQTLYSGLSVSECILISQFDLKKYYTINNMNNDIGKNSRQQIFYGAPGTGKSHYIEERTTKDNSIRTTFHPDSDYSTFVGAYKPIMGKGNVYGSQGPLKDEKGLIEEEKIKYQFIPQAFLKAYTKAWNIMAEAKNNGKEAEPYFLIIEEINRGNCAQIFGDLFQLLDRSRSGYSSYNIFPDSDIQKFLAEDEVYGFKKEFDVDDVYNDKGDIIATSEEIKNGERLVLPYNLHIWATMNTSDQSLFPIDSAFKRRWDWKYMKIKDEGKEWKINIIEKDDEQYDWWTFIEQINKIISNMTSSADKQLGYFFCKPDEKIGNDDEPKLITAGTFVGKVLFYLWNDVFKDYAYENKALFTFKDKNDIEKDLTFPDFYKDDDQVDEDVVKQFLTNVMNWKPDNTSDQN